jgi:hypothetical protein
MMNEGDKAELHDAEECCRRFLQWNLLDESKHGSLDVRNKLDGVLGRIEQELLDGQD